MTSVIRIEYDVDKREERHLALNKKARDIHSIAQNINEKIYDQDQGLDRLIKKNKDTSAYVVKAQDELTAYRVALDDKTRILSKRKRVYCLICIAVSCLMIMTYMIAM